MYTLKHENIIEFVDLFEEDDWIIIIMELADHGSLNTLIE